MATVDMTAGSNTSRPSVLATPLAYRVERYLDWADAVTDKGSALAAADVFELIDIPAETLLLAAGAEVEVVGNATAATIDVGVGGDADAYVDGGDVIAATGYLAAGTNGDIALATGKRFTSADTLDVTLATLTGTLSTGKVRVYAIMVDLSGKAEPAAA